MNQNAIHARSTKASSNRSISFKKITAFARPTEFAPEVQCILSLIPDCQVGRNRYRTIVVKGFAISYSKRYSVSTSIIIIEIIKPKLKLYFVKLPSAFGGVCMKTQSCPFARLLSQFSRREFAPRYTNKDLCII